MKTITCYEYRVSGGMKSYLINIQPSTNYNIRHEHKVMGCLRNDC